MIKPEDIISGSEYIFCFVNKSLGHHSFYITQHGLLLNQFTASHVVPIVVLLQIFLKPRTKYCRVGSSVPMQKQMSALRCTVGLSTAEWEGRHLIPKRRRGFGVQLDNPHYHSMYSTQRISRLATKFPIQNSIYNFCFATHQHMYIKHRNITGDLMWRSTTSYPTIIKSFKL